MSGRLATVIAFTSATGAYFYLVGYLRLNAYLGEFGLSAAAIDSDPQEIIAIQIVPTVSAWVTVAAVEFSRFYDEARGRTALSIQLEVPRSNRRSRSRPSAPVRAGLWLLILLIHLGPIVFLFLATGLEWVSLRNQPLFAGLLLGWCLADILGVLKPWLFGDVTLTRALTRDRTLSFLALICAIVVLIGYPRLSELVAQRAADDLLTVDGRPMTTACLLENDAATDVHVIGGRHELVFVRELSGRVRAITLTDADLLYLPNDRPIGRTRPAGSAQIICSTTASAAILRPAGSR